MASDSRKQLQAAIENASLTLKQLRKALANPCSPGCKGWFVSDIGTDRVAVVACDDCRHDEHTGKVMYYDEDIALLPEARVAIVWCNSQRGTISNG